MEPIKRDMLYRDHSLPLHERERNAGLAVMRALVAAIFSTLKHAWGLARRRLDGLNCGSCQ